MIIFDLDQTIINSSISESFRKRREWSEVYKLIPKFELYDGILSVLNIVKRNGIKICIVTSSPGSYCTKVIKQWNIPCDYTVCYHDTVNKKPHPEPINKALAYFNISSELVLSLGDKDIDIEASRKANVKSVGCLWGANDKTTLINSNPNFIINSPNEILNIASGFYTNFEATKF